MPSQWLSCPHCKALFQVNAANPPSRCPQCQGTVRLPSAVATPVAPAAQSGYFYAQNNKKHGPVTLARLRELAGAGQLHGGDMVLPEGTGKWQVASSLPGVFPAEKPAVANGTKPPLPSGWYYAQGRKRVGPVTLEMMHQLMAFGMIRPTDLVLAEGSPKWQLASSHPALTPTGNGTVETSTVRWFYAQKNQKHGPVCREFLQQLANDGDLQPGDMILPEGTAKWIRADALTDLFPERRIHSAPPPVLAEVRAPVPAASPSADEDDSVFPDSKPVPAPPPVPPPPPPPPVIAVQEASSDSDEDLFGGRRASILAEDTARPRAHSPADSFVPDLSEYEEQPPSIVGDDKPVGSVFDSFVGGIISSQPLPPVQKPRRIPAGQHACTHCHGTAYCGWKWDSAGVIESGQACAVHRKIRSVARRRLGQGDLLVLPR